jgi:putative DNA primase/helicase
MFLDLCDARWRAIEITSEGWWVDPNPTVRFLRSNQLPLPEPERGASIDLLRDLVHLASDDDFKLVVGWLLGALQPIGPFPILAILGEHGSGKSSAARMIQQLVDPHKAGLRAEPKSVDDLIVGAKQTRVLGFDNISHIQPWLSDALCRLATGGALTKRQLYTNDEEVILNTTNAVLISAIPEVITRSDLLDRTLKVSTSGINPGNRREEAEVAAMFASLAPRILGALLTGVSTALAQAQTVKVKNLPRMADWASWATLAEAGLGWEPRTILDAHARMQSTVVETAVDEDPLARAVLRLPRPWRGTATDLLQKLTPVGKAPRGWPEGTRALGNQLRRLVPNLRHVGVACTFFRTPDNRIVLIESIARPGTPSSSSSLSGVASHHVENLAAGDLDERSGVVSAGVPRRRDVDDDHDDVPGVAIDGEEYVVG